MLKRTRPSFGTPMIPSSTKDLNWIYIVVGILIALFIIIIICYSTNESFKNKIDEAFSNIKNVGTGTAPSPQLLKDLDILFLMDPQCPKCTSMISTLQKEGTLPYFKIYDVNSSEGEQIATKYGAKDLGVPNFISMTLSTGCLGQKENTAEIVRILTKNGSMKPEDVPKTEGPVDGRKLLQSLGVIFFKMNGCSHCTAMESKLQEHGVLDTVEVVESSDPKFQEYITKYGLQVKSFPTFYSQATGKTVVGSMPLEKLVNDLSV